VIEKSVPKLKQKLVVMRKYGCLSLARFTYLVPTAHTKVEPSRKEKCNPWQKAMELRGV